MRNKRFAVIFDMDGVIIDSNPLITRVWKAFFNTHQIVLTDEQLNYYIFGRTGPETVAMVFPGSLNKNLIDAYAIEFSKEVQRLYSSEGKIVPGFEKLVKDLHAHDIPMAIATSAPPENVRIVLELARVAEFIKIITDASHVHHSKPHPEVYLTTAERLMISPANCLVFEDSFSGIQSAKSAGMHVIGVATTHAKSELAPLAHEVITNFADISVADINKLMEK